MRRPSPVYLMLTATIILWAFNFTVTKYVITHGFQPLAYSSIRYCSAAVLFAAFTYRREGSVTVGRRDVLLLLAAAVLGVWLNQVTYVYSLRFTTATTVALILGTTPIFAALLAYAVGLERISARFVAAALVSFGGVSLVALGSGGGVSSDVKGDLLALATAASWAAYSVAIAPLMRRYSPFRVSAAMLLFGCAPLVATAAKQLVTQDYSNLGSLVWIGLGYAVLGPLIVTNIFWFTAVGRVGPSRATLFANLQPFLAAVFALLVLSERMTWLQAAGGIGIALGITLARRRSRDPVLVAGE